MTTQRVERTDHAGGTTGYFRTDAPDRETMLELVRKRFPHVRVEGQPDPYVQALYDLAIAKIPVDPTHVGKDKLGQARERERQRQRERGDDRADLEARARKILGPQARVDGESDRQIHERVIRSVSPAAQLHDKCDNYVTGRADSIMADADFWNGPTGSRLRSRSTRTDATPTRDDEDDAEPDVRADAHAEFLASRRGAPARTDGADLRRFDAVELAERTGDHVSLIAALAFGRLAPALAPRADALTREVIKLGMEPPAALRSRFEQVLEERADAADPRATAHQRFTGARRSAPAPVPAQRADLDDDSDDDSDRDDDDAATPQRDPRASAHQQFMNTRNGGK